MTSQSESRLELMIELKILTGIVEALAAIPVPVVSDKTVSVQGKNKRTKSKGKFGHYFLRLSPDMDLMGVTCLQSLTSTLMHTLLHNPKVCSFSL